MERMTERDEFGNADIIALSDMMPEIYAELSFSETNALTEALNRLAKYEDTGLEPDEIEFYREAQDHTESMSPKRFIEIAQAEKDGRLVVQEHGLWETHLLPLAWKCSVCGFKNSFRAGKSTEYLNYCPCCGAKMDKEEDSETD